MFSLARARFTWLLLSLLAPGLFAQAVPEGRQLEIDERFPRVRVVAWPRGAQVDDALFRAIRAEIEAAAELGPTALVLDIDSGGGSVTAAQEISDLIREYRRHEDLRIFAYVGPDREAISAAAWIALACRGLLIAPDAVIGDIQPLALTMRGYENVPEKIVTKLTEDVWLAARDNGLSPTYPELFVRAMVDKDVEILAVRNPRLGTGEEFIRASEFGRWSAERRADLVTESVSMPGRAFTTNGRDLLRFGFPVRLIDDRDALIDVLGTPDAVWEVRTIEETGVFDLGFINWSWVILAIAAILLVMELQAPGLGIFGVLAVMALIGFFLAQFGFEDRAFLAGALLLTGAFLIVVEAVLLPGLFVPGIVGVVLVLYATWIGITRPESPSLLPWPSWSDERSREGLAVWAGTLAAMIGLVFLTSMTLGRFLHRVPLLGRVVIIPPPAVGAEAEGAATATGGPGREDVVVGARGRALTPLRPAGIATIGGRKIDVVGRGPFVEAGREVTVCEVSGNRVVVREVPAASAPEAPAP